MDDGVFAGFLVAEIPQNFRKISFVTAQEFDHVLNAEFVEIHAAFLRPPTFRKSGSFPSGTGW